MRTASPHPGGSPGNLLHDIHGEEPPRAPGTALGTGNTKVGRQNRHSGAPSRDQQPESCRVLGGSTEPRKGIWWRWGWGGGVRDRGLVVLGSTVRKTRGFEQRLE